MILKKQTRHTANIVGLKRHLEKIHDIILSKEEEPSNKTRCVQLKIDSMTKKVSLGE